MRELGVDFTPAGAQVIAKQSHSCAALTAAITSRSSLEHHAIDRLQARRYSPRD